MDDEWDTYDANASSEPSDGVKGGRTFGKGRGFVAKSNDDDWGASKNFSSNYKRDNPTENNTWNSGNNDDCWDDNADSQSNDYSSNNNYLNEDGNRTNFSDRGNRRGGRGGRGRERGGRDGFRGGDRDGFRGGDRDGHRGGDRDGFKGGDRDGFRGDRDGFRGGGRDRRRGGDRDGHRGGDRDGFRGGNRDGFRGGDRDENRGEDDDEYSGGDRDGYRGSDRDGFRGDRNRGGRGGERGGRGGRGGDRNEFGGDRDRYGGGKGGYGDTNENNDGPEKKREIYTPPEKSTDENDIFHSGNTTGINFTKYDSIEVKTTGENVPPPITSFETVGLRDLLLENIKKSDYTKPTPIQKQAIPIVLNGRDLMACAQTGSGKTAAFLIPIIHQLLENPTELVIEGNHVEPQCIIISPTRELASQIFDEAFKFAYRSVLKICLAYGGTSVRSQLDRIMRGCHILVATPGRMNDFVKRGNVTFNSTRFVVLDEADRMLDMGFISDVEQFMDHDSMVPTGQRQTLMFSATFPEEIQHLAGKFLNNYIFVAVGIVGGACTDVEQTFYKVSKFEKRPKLLDILKEDGTEKTLIFVETKRSADFLATFLSEANFPTTSIHGDRLQREREEALRDFKRGTRHILVATGVAARGLDIKNVKHVINFDLPKSIDEYVHRIGRTGRVGNRGKATSFYEETQDNNIASALVKILKQADQTVPGWLGSGSGSLYGGNSEFGGIDYRDGNYGNNTMNPDEPEEAW